MVKEIANLEISRLSAAYARGEIKPSSLVRTLYERIAASGADAIWITRVPLERALERAHELESSSSARNLPLYGIPFAVKDNIDVAGMATTAALPVPARNPTRSATVVDRLLSAGAILIGKTNLDQLACGLVGTRSPYGIPPNPFNAAYIPGGSSSGSATAVSHGLVSFALGTDTAGSGRVPAAFNNLVGLKPSQGLLSTTGLVPACRSLDCISVFAQTVKDAVRVADVARGYDPLDPASRSEADSLRFSGDAPHSFRFGVPLTDQLQFFGDVQAERAFSRALARMTELGGQRVDIDFTPFSRAAELLYGGPWVAERVAVLGELSGTDDLLPVIRSIFADAERYDAMRAFQAFHQLAALQREAERCFENIDALFVPTTPTIYTIDEIAKHPREYNSRLGVYTNFVNLLKLAGIAVPNGMREDGLPTGVTLLGPRDSDARLAALAARFLGEASAKETAGTRPATTSAKTQLAVVGAHLSGQPLNAQLTDLGATLIKTCCTASSYRLFALSGMAVKKPGLLRTPDGQGHAIELEVWELTEAALGSFMQLVKAPLCIGTVLLEDGSSVLGFLCESQAVASAEDISHFGGWRAYLKQSA